MTQMSIHHGSSLPFALVPTATPRSLRLQELEYQLGPRVFQPQPHALPWQGVRVLELSCRSWTAALCGQVMAACGAEARRRGCRFQSVPPTGAKGGSPQRSGVRLHKGSRRLWRASCSTMRFRCSLDVPECGERQHFELGFLDQWFEALKPQEVVYDNEATFF